MVAHRVEPMLFGGMDSTQIIAGPESDARSLYQQLVKLWHCLHHLIS
jgi:hypothetical protein